MFDEVFHQSPDEIQAGRDPQGRRGKTAAGANEGSA